MVLLSLKLVKTNRTNKKTRPWAFMGPEHRKQGRSVVLLEVLLVEQDPRKRYRSLAQFTRRP